MHYAGYFIVHVLYSVTLSDLVILHMRFQFILHDRFPDETIIYHWIIILYSKGSWLAIVSHFLEDHLPFSPSPTYALKSCRATLLLKLNHIQPGWGTTGVALGESREREPQAAQLTSNSYLHPYHLSFPLHSIKAQVCLYGF